jgi:hypothetical protein
MVTARRGRPAARRMPSRPALTVALRALFIAAVAASLLGGVAGGLLRVGVVLPLAADVPWLAQAGAQHAALMICGFLGTVIGIERAVAVKLRLAFVAPLASALGGVCLLLGRGAPGAGLMVVAALVFVAVNVVVVARQRAAHTWLLLVAALAWLCGCALFALQEGAAAALPWWFAFLVMTIAAERLEMTRLMRRGPSMQALLGGVLLLMLTGAAGSAGSPAVGGLLFGASLTLLAVWLALFDIARRTVFARGLSRYMAVCLLGGYAWLAVAGAAWAGSACGLPLRDAALHALGLGFIVSMMMGHAPVILPAVARVKLQFGALFYLPLLALHGSLALRLGAGLGDVAMRALGAVGNAAAIAAFVLTIAGAALAWQIHHHRASRAAEVIR